MEKQIEAEAAMKKGDKAMQTGLLKWSKDYASAAMHYEEAAKLFRISKDFVNAKRVFEKNIKVNEKLNDPWSCGRNYESIVLMTVDGEDKSDVEDLIAYTNKATYYFKLAESPQNYISLSQKVCKFLEKNNQYVYACELYETLIKDLEDSENHYIRNEVMTSYISLLVNMMKFEEVGKLYEKEIESRKKDPTSRNTLNSMALSVICIYLILGDIDKADNLLQHYMTQLRDFIKSNEVTAAEKLVDFYIDGNQKEFTLLTNKPVINSIFPINIVKNLRKVVVKACPSKRKVEELDDMGYDVPEGGIVSMGADGGMINMNVEANVPKTEEEKQKMLADFMS